MSALHVRRCDLVQPSQCTTFFIASQAMRAGASATKRLQFRPEPPGVFAAAAACLDRSIDRDCGLQTIGRHAMSDDPHWAHVRIDPTTGKPVPHLLHDHLLGVADRASVFAASFGADWARLAGLWHDLSGSAVAAVTRGSMPPSHGLGGIPIGYEARQKKWKLFDRQTLPNPQLTGSVQTTVTPRPPPIRLPAAQHRPARDRQPVCRSTALRVAPRNAGHATAPQNAPPKPNRSTLISTCAATPAA